ncbi:MAG TPA: efflux transporter outer membrane subunit [Burkholderiaceae bacterium]|nr:efflux transporter outer membrane subunit [Burkholderiaceae bacterium]
MDIQYKLTLPAASRLSLLAFACMAALGGCAAGPDYVRPSANLPSTYVAGPNISATVASEAKLGEAQTFVPERDIPAQWWELFHSQPLNDLVTASLKQNPNVDAAQAALRGAMENVYAQQGFFYPTVDASFAPTRQKVANTLASGASSGASYYNLFTAQVSVSYTADVFGANRRQVESLKAQEESQRFQLEATYLTLSSNVVSAAIQEAGLRGQIDATKEIIASQTKLMEMFNHQYQLGQVAVADVAAQEAALATAEATLPPLEKQLAVQRDLLNALAGRFPSEVSTAKFDLDSLKLPTELPLFLPSTLVEHRPDVRAAEELLHAASADVGVAAANRLPNITLGISSYGSAALTLADLFKSGTGFWELAGGLAQPVFDGGTLKHRENAAKAAYDQAAAQYRATVLNAFQNVADCLQAVQSDAVALRATDKAERAAAKSLAIARRQLALGDISTLTLLGSEQAYQQAKLNLVQAQTNRLQDTVALFQSLGGGFWNKSTHEAAANQD